MNIYSKKAEERRKQFNRIINGIDMVLMNNIPEVDASVWDNWESITPNQTCEIEETEADNEEHLKAGDMPYYCVTHMIGSDDEYACEETDENNEIYQWFAVNENDADFLKRHNQYITYSDMLDTYFLAICHLGTSWDYVESMVADFEDMYILDGLDDEKEVV